MSDKKNKSIDDFDESNAKALAEMLIDPQTSEAVRLQIINELNEVSKSQSFFETAFNEELSLGACPGCHHENHWLVPEDNLAQMGWVSSQKDPRIKHQTDAKSCPQYAEACSKKKTTA